MCEAAGRMEVPISETMVDQKLNAIGRTEAAH
jgi:hypothetical protein